MAPASALVTVTVSTAGGGVISTSPGGVTEGMAIALQPGMGTAGEACVGRGVSAGIVVVVGAHPAASVSTTTPKRVIRGLGVMDPRYQGFSPSATLPGARIVKSIWEHGSRPGPGSVKATRAADEPAAATHRRRSAPLMSYPSRSRSAVAQGSIAK